MTTDFTNCVRIRVAASGLNTHPKVQQRVVRGVLANHKRRVISPGAISVMNDGQFRQWMPEGFFGPDAVKTGNGAFVAHLPVIADSLVDSHLTSSGSVVRSAYGIGVPARFAILPRRKEWKDILGLP